MHKFDTSADDFWSTTDNNFDEDGEEANEAQEESSDDQTAEVR